ncbi:MAG: B12-binding domain-containing radical SAM protein [Thermodesulfobacteriota bacterium]
MFRKIKKVLLFVPPAYTLKEGIDINPLPPMGLGYLGSVLENNDIEVRIVDCLLEGWYNRDEISSSIIRIGMPFEQIEDIIKSYGPDIVGVNNLFTKQRENAHKIYSIVKKVDKNIITIAGGAHPTAMPEAVMSDGNLDYAVLGEGEQALIDLISVFEGRNDLSMLDGVAYRKNSETKILPKTRFIEDLDSIPFPARHLLNMEKYFGLKASHGERKYDRFTPIITSRGCSAKCTFCTAYKVWGRKFRTRSPQNVIAEMRHLRQKYGIEEIMFEDDNVTLNPKRAEIIFDKMMTEKLDLKWDTPNGVAAWTLSEQLIYKMKESGCYRINFAIESGNQYVLDKIIKKPLKLEKVKPLVKYARNIGVDVSIFLVVGMPGETEKQIWDSFQLAADLEIYNPHISVATPYPGSELYDICKEKGYLRDDFSLDDLYIRSFPIKTQDWDDKKLKRIVTDGQKYILTCYFKKHPILFLKTYIKRLFNSPRHVLRKTANLFIPRLQF